MCVHRRDKKEDDIEKEDNVDEVATHSEGGCDYEDETIVIADNDDQTNENEVQVSGKSS